MSENLLRLETSPYLLQHRDNPVHWRGWNAAALEEARQLDRPILLSIGYAACHWCHVMAHESFEDPATAAVMNRLFVNIKVDREERPDIDQIYMAALHAIGDQGGWPLTMFLTPDGKPIWGGTYFPRTSRYGRPGFVDVLEQIARFYAEDRDEIVAQADRIAAHLQPRPEGDGPPLGRPLLDEAARAILGIMDLDKGGTRGAPKFPNTAVIDFLARSAHRTGDSDMARAVDAALIGMSNGGIFDHVGGGFARYSTDADWLVPHFEKMLSDNGLLLEQLALLAGISGAGALYRARIETTIGWLVREMRLPGGAFAASLDADSEGHEGRFYVWTRAELEKLLGAEDAAFLGDLHDIRDGGNWEGVSIPNRLQHPAPLAADAAGRAETLLAKLLSARETRVRPGLDDKILVDWNGYAITGLATAGWLLDRPDWTELAATAFRFLAESISRNGRPGHATRDGKSVHPGFSSDLASLARAAIALHQATQEGAYLDRAIGYLDQLKAHHGDGQGGYFFTADDAEALILRKAERIDDASPNPHGLAVDSLVRLWALTGEDRFRDRADRALAAAAPIINRNVFGTASLLSGLDLRLAVRTVVILTSATDDGAKLRSALREDWRPTFVLDVRPEDHALPASHPAHGKRAIDGRATAYVCREGNCSLPITDAEALVAVLHGAWLPHG
ncbi:thioredoxin domain-containing protein [Kaistia nematophila]|uniref:Thioredoxin domain-containing protein n=1 Tax=Kaistia nematophila TaxID=2994654 RepID=A0A9X3IJC9_9HYPH|nr:thioredoxin domain-containing protein [Kaistia nematophila]MCX5567617.1 thioredoxin domain-containing protein [Kaistia nematophila]